ncbi:MAG: response regulator [Deltaproteobacteria bacterium]|nr:MAG: response regulator [Deltaproteobacteria bacterium]
MRILLVDDEVELVSTLAERLELRGMDADWQETAAGAIEAAGKQSYAIAVLDVKLPGASGLELRVRLEQMQPEMKFIFVTGHGCEEAFEQGREAAGCEYYLVKPVSIELLVSKIEDVLGKKAR